MPDNTSATSTPPATSLAALWAENRTRFNASRLRIDTCGKWRRNEVAPYIPADAANAEAFRVILPHAINLSMEVPNFLAEHKQPALSRKALGTDPKSERVAEKITKWVQAAIEELMVNGEDIWPTLLAAGTHDGEYAVLVQPRPSHWKNLLTLYEQDEKGEDVKDGAGNPVIRPTFQRDAKGRAEDDPWFSEPGTKRSFKIDDKASLKAKEAYERKAKARALPFVVRLIPASMCIPLGIDPQTGKVDGLLIQSQRTATGLQRDGFTWTALSGGVSSQSAGTLSSTVQGGTGQTFTLYELWSPGKVEYEIGGPGGERIENHNTQLNGQTAVVDLEAEYDICDVPGGYYYGGHWAHETDLDKKGVPFLYPLINILAGLNQTISMDIAHMFQFAWGGWFIKPDQELAQQAELWTENGKPRKLEIKPMEAQYVVGDPTPAVHPGSNSQVGRWVELGLSITQSYGTKGSPNDASGFAQGVNIASQAANFNQIIAGATSALERIAECLLEQAASLSTKTGQSVPVSVHVDTKGKVFETIEVTADDLQGNWEVEVNFPNRPGANIPLAQAMYAWAQGDKPMISHETWLRDGYGIDDPSDEVDRIWVERQLDSPEGEQLVLGLAAKIQGNEELQKLHDLTQQGKVAPGGTPMALIPPRPDQMGASGQGQPTDASGISMNPGASNPAAGAVGGIVAAANETRPMQNIIAATGQAVPTAA